LLGGTPFASQLGLIFLYRATPEASMQAVFPTGQAQFARQKNQGPFLRLLEVIPAAAYTTDAEGLLTFFNQRAVEVWGRAPKLNDPIDRY
jgi:PAS domain-containing protein